MIPYQVYQSILPYPEEHHKRLITRPKGGKEILVHLGRHDLDCIRDNSGGLFLRDCCDILARYGELKEYCYR